MSDSWLTLGVRVGEKRTWSGEELREIGLEPDPDLSAPVALRVTHVSSDTITVQSMSEPEKIEPALTAEEWAKKASGDFSIDGTQLWGQDEQRWGNCWIDAAKAIALANAALSDSDPRKITREWVRLLTKINGAADQFDAAADGCDEAGEQRDAVAWRKDADLARSIADALESYLPPEAAT